MKRRKIRILIFGCFLITAAAASQGILSAKDEATKTDGQEQESSAEVKNWGGGYEDCTHRIR